MRWLMAILALFVAAPVAMAQEAEPNKVWEATKAVVDALDPAIEAGLFFDSSDIGNAEAFNGLSAALYTYDQHELDIASLRLGVALEQSHKIYATAQVNLINMTKLYAPDDVKEALSPAFMAKVWEFLGTYARAGVGPGFDVESEQFGVVATVGGAVQF